MPMESMERELWLEDAMNRWERSLLRTCYAYLGDVALAEDAVQETFLKAWKGFGRFRGASEERTWLMRIAINTCKDMRRSAWFRHVDRAAALEDLPECAEPFAPEDDTLTRAVMALKPKLREAALLHWYQQLSAEEAAKALGVSRATVYNRLEKARKLLRTELEVCDHED
jgi:RNA polymerase sigma factor (sigma-70 family)